MIKNTKIVILLVALACGAAIGNAVTMSVSAWEGGRTFDMKQFVAPSSTSCYVISTGWGATGQVHGGGISLVALNGESKVGNGSAGNYVIYANAPTYTARATVSW